MFLWLFSPATSPPTPRHHRNTTEGPAAASAEANRMAAAAIRGARGRGAGGGRAAPLRRDTWRPGGAAGRLGGRGRGGTSCRGRPGAAAAVAGAEAAGRLVTVAAVGPAAAGALAAVLKPVLGVTSFLMIPRIVLTWFPENKDDEFPWSLAVKPTDPLLNATKDVIKPVNGVDVNPIVWFALISFVNEILVGPQGLLILISRKG